MFFPAIHKKTQHLKTMEKLILQQETRPKNNWECDIQIEDKLVEEILGGFKDKKTDNYDDIYEKLQLEILKKLKRMAFKYMSEITGQYCWNLWKSLHTQSCSVTPYH